MVQVYKLGSVMHVQAHQNLTSLATSDAIDPLLNVSRSCVWAGEP